MKFRAHPLAALPLTLALALSSVACGGGTPKAATANVVAGAMPEGESWNGVYYNTIFGNLHMKQEGEHIVGRWKRTDQSAWGELDGSVKDNLVKFEWKEHKIGLVGPAAEVHGKGYFVYSKVADEKFPKLAGEFGQNEDEVGGKWDCVKQLNVKLDLNSINGDTGAVSAPAGDTGWQ
jgi:hypothetical protein